MKIFFISWGESQMMNMGDRCQMKLQTEAKFFWMKNQKAVSSDQQGSPFKVKWTPGYNLNL